jgi:hypothetical protein
MHALYADGGSPKWSGSCLAQIQKIGNQDAREGRVVIVRVYIYVHTYNAALSERWRGGHYACLTTYRDLHGPGGL